ncbi:DegV family protein [Companilactobacillus allii]|uniref:Fatty acid-binding protein DegV n=1 Tax=Companilactobacillus allii TaxID=1847728 RepID=A0A1P8Q0B8_9LACO|nr:DegV family protein [Companilactobacillus allii]APX71314.1 fatty acid-binding protein DegV [Companilactobacillus allii]USQ68396.1 DegV family protein [Companilactobacillus allii]
MTERIAILMDSCCDIPEEYLQKAGVYELPLQIIYKDKTYKDRIDITAIEVYNNLDKEIPKTSLPSGECITDMLDKIHNDGYDHIISISVSSGLSGTYNFLKVLLEDDDRFTFTAFDTKQVAVAAGLIGVGAKDMVDAGKSYEEVALGVKKMINNTVVYFCIPTLEYLRAGGRIGLVTSVVGNMLKLAPIITCNDEGIYTTAAKARGMKKGQKLMLDFVNKFVDGHKDYLLAVGHGADEVAGKRMVDLLGEDNIKGSKQFFGQVGPALGVHTGPGLVGVGVVLLD